MGQTKELAEKALPDIQEIIHQRTGKVARFLEKFFTPTAAQNFIENLMDWQFSVAYQSAKAQLVLLAAYAYGGVEEAKAYLNARQQRIERYGAVRR